MTWRRLVRVGLLVAAASSQPYMSVHAQALAATPSLSFAASRAAAPSEDAGVTEATTDVSGSNATDDFRVLSLTCEAQGLFGVAVLGKRGVFCVAQEPCAGKPGSISRFACPNAGQRDVSGAATLEKGSCCAELTTGIIGCVSLDSPALDAQCLPPPAWFTPVETPTPTPAHTSDEPTPPPTTGEPTATPTTDGPTLSPTPTSTPSPSTDAPTNSDPDAGDPTPTASLSPSPLPATPTPPAPWPWTWTPGVNEEGSGSRSDNSSSSNSSDSTGPEPDVGSDDTPVVTATQDPVALEQDDRARNDFETLQPIIETTPGPTIQRLSEPGPTSQPTSSSSSSSSSSMNDNTLVFLVVGAVASVAIVVGAVMLHRKTTPDRTTASVQEMELEQGTPDATELELVGAAYSASTTPRDELM